MQSIGTPKKLDRTCAHGASGEVERCCHVVDIEVERTVEVSEMAGSMLINPVDRELHLAFR